MIVMLVVQSHSDKQFPSTQTEQRQGPRTKTQRSLSEARILEWRWNDMKKQILGWTFLKPTIVLVSSWMFRRREQGSAAPPTWFSYDSWSFLWCKLSIWAQLHPKQRQDRDCKLYQIHDRNVVYWLTHGLRNWSVDSGSYSSAQHPECRDRLGERGTKKMQIACEQCE